VIKTRVVFPKFISKVEDFLFLGIASSLVGAYLWEFIVKPALAPANTSVGQDSS
jgi:hypothetical protein